MNKIFLQLDTRLAKYREPVENANDLRYAADQLWTSLNTDDTCRCSTLWLDLVHENGEPLTEEEREDFFDCEARDRELAFGRVCPDASIEFEAEEDVIRSIVDVENVPAGVRVGVYRGNITVEAEAHFVSYPNRHFSEFHQYEGVDEDAAYACSDLMTAINATADAIVNVLEASGIVPEEIYKADAESLDIYHQQCDGNYVVADLDDLTFGSISFDKP